MTTSEPQAREHAPGPSANYQLSPASNVTTSRRWNARKMAAGIAISTLLVGGGVIGSLVVTSGDGGVAAEEIVEHATAKVEVRDLVEYASYDGELGYGEPATISSPSAGTLTMLPDIGTEISRGMAIYAINDEPVVVLTGDHPAWRELSSTSSAGTDIRQLEENLAALGYDPDGEMVVDDIFDDVTAEAVRRWERDLGVEANGVVELGQVVFLPGTVQVTTWKVAAGDAVQPGVPVLEVTSTRSVITARSQFSKVGDSARYTSLADEGAMIERGQVLYEYTIDDGADWDTDLFDRELRVGSNPGRDVRHLEENLVALGYDPLREITVDDTFDDATAEAVARWEDDLGITVDGVLEPEQLAGLDEGGRVAVVAIFGEREITRQLSTSSSAGDDIRTLEANLVALGYDAGGDLLVDDSFDEATAEAVTAWERDLGITGDGIVEPGQVVVVPRETRIDAVFVEDGETIGRNRPILDLSASQRVVTMELPIDDASLLAEGDDVEVELSDRTTISGTVTDMADVATVDPASSSEDASITVTIAPGALPDDLRLSEMPVEIHVVSELVEGVLAVPVNALLALVDGGYAVEVVDDLGTTRLVRVETGRFADGWVEIEGEGLNAGSEVVVPQ